MKPQNSAFPFCVAFCGGIATGKSTLISFVAEALARKGFSPTLIDFDQIRRIILLKCSNHHQSRKLFKLLDLNSKATPQEVSRAILKSPARMIAFGDLLGRELLEHSIPKLRKDHESILLLEWPGLPPKILQRSLVSSIVSISCSTREQLRRLLDGDLSPQEVRHRIRVQRRVERLFPNNKGGCTELRIDTTDNSPDEYIPEILSWIISGYRHRTQFEMRAA